YLFKEPAYNTFDKELAMKRQVAGNLLIGEKDISVQPLGLILSKAVSEEQQIDFMTIDIEGYDLQAFKSNECEKVRPSIILIEIYASSVSECLDNEISIYLDEMDYRLVSKLRNTCFFEDRRFQHT